VVTRTGESINAPHIRFVREIAVTFALRRRKASLMWIAESNLFYLVCLIFTFVCFPWIVFCGRGSSAVHFGLFAFHNQPADQKVQNTCPATSYSIDAAYDCGDGGPMQPKRQRHSLPSLRKGLFGNLGGRCSWIVFVAFASSSFAASLLCPTCAGEVLLSSKSFNVVART